MGGLIVAGALLLENWDAVADFFVSMAQVMFTDGRFLERLHA